MQEIAQPLLRWFDENKRSLPFRAHKTPYRVWVSEVMLQQTRVAAVLPYYERFMRELPTVQALAACPPEKLAKLWEGLGYYSRAQPAKGGAGRGGTIRRRAARQLRGASRIAGHWRLHRRGCGKPCIWPAVRRGGRQCAACVEQAARR